MPAHPVDSMPASIDPMRAVSGELPTDDEAWAYEIKWDGMRAIAFCDAGHLRLHSSNGIDATVRFPEVAPLAAALAGHRVVLDGEIVTFTPEGRPDFGLLQGRMHITSPTEAIERAGTQPVAYVVFDLLWFDGHDVMPVPYLDRKRLLADLVEPGPSWEVPEAKLGDGQELLDAAEARGLEGLIAKRRDSTYEPGRRSGAWRKLKVRRQQEVVVGGWLPGSGNRSSTLGALLIGYHDDAGVLRYAGRVGSGFNDHELRDLVEVLGPLARDSSPFTPEPPRATARLAHWVEPELVVEVAFGEWTTDGVLRHPSFLGRRFDKDPAHVRREPTY